MHSEAAEILLEHSTWPEAIAKEFQIPIEDARGSLREATVEQGKFGSGVIVCEGLPGGATYLIRFPGHCPTCGQVYQCR